MGKVTVETEEINIREPVIHEHGDSWLKIGLQICCIGLHWEKET